MQNRSGSFRESVQPLVRDAAMRGDSVSATARVLRQQYGHAYRRADMLEDLRRHRSSVRDVAIASYRDLRHRIARAGLAAFSVALLVPTIAHGVAPVDQTVLVAASHQDVTAAALERVALPNLRSTLEPTIAPEPIPDPTPQARPAPTPRPLAITSGVWVTASWYGPGFYGNRLPCWQWLQANGKPVQLEADTWGVANKTFPCGTMLVLTHGANTVTVPVVDRGPYVPGRDLDLAPAVKAALACTDLCTLVMRIP